MNALTYRKPPRTASRRAFLFGAAAAVCLTYAIPSWAAITHATLTEAQIRTQWKGLLGLKRFDVKEYGAVGNGSTNDQVAIQAAVTAMIAAGGGEVYFPKQTGNYVLNSAVVMGTANISFAFVGEPGVKIFGNFNGFLIDVTTSAHSGGSHIIQGFEFENAHTTGKAVRFNSLIGGVIIDCRFGANDCIHSYNSQSIAIVGCSLVGANIGIMAGNATNVYSCDITGFAEGIRHQNVGLAVHGGRLEENDIGILLGKDENGNNFNSTGFDIAGLSMEANQVGILVSSGGAGKISSISIGGGIQMQYGLRLLNAFDLLVSGVSVNGGVVLDPPADAYTGAAISLEGCGRVTMISCSVNVSHGTEWNIATGLSSYQLIQCGGGSGGGTPVLVTVAQLPTSAPVGTIFGITDATVTTVGTTAVGGGTNDVSVVRSAGVWRII